MIQSFASKETGEILSGKFSRRLRADIQRSARRRMLYLDNAESLQDLHAVPGYRLEKLKGNRSGRYSIRINNEWRICFSWVDNHAQDVEIVDYHS